jgi:hypothetical protein
MRSLCAATLALALLLTGCSDDGSPSQAPWLDRSPAGASNSDELDDLLLTLDDLPGGFDVDESSDDESDPGEIVDASSEACEVLWEGTENPFDEEKVPETEIAFTGGDAGPYVMQFLTTSDASELSEELDDFRGAVEECTSFTVAADGFTSTFDIATADAPDVGDESFAFTMDMTMGDDDFELDGLATVAMISVGEYAMVLMGMEFDLGGGTVLDARTFDAIVQAAVERLEGAAA